MVYKLVNNIISKINTQFGLFHFNLERCNDLEEFREGIRNSVVIFATCM